MPVESSYEADSVARDRMIQILRFPCDCRRNITVGICFPVHAQIRPHTIVFLASAKSDAKSRQQFVEHQHDSKLITDISKEMYVFRRCLYEPNIDHDRLQDDRSQVVLMLAYQFFCRLNIVKRKYQSGRHRSRIKSAAARHCIRSFFVSDLV